jgi:L-iditol 2-dehydrogenase
VREHFADDGAYERPEDQPGYAQEESAQRTERLPPGVVQSCCSSATYDPIGEPGYSVDRGGTVMFFAPTDPGVGTAIDINKIWSNDIAIKTSYAAAPEDLKESMDLIASKRFKVSDLITHRFGMSEIQKAFDVVCKAQDSLKVIIYHEK